MSQIVKDGDKFGIQVPVCSGICSSPSSSTNVPLNGQFVIGTTTRPATNNQIPLYVGDGSTPLKNLDPVNKVLPLNGKNIAVERPGSNEDSQVGGFTVDDHSLDGDETDVSVQKIKNFTAENVKVILESGSYGTGLPNSGVEGQLFFLVQPDIQQTT